MTRCSFITHGLPHRGGERAALRAQNHYYPHIPQQIRHVKENPHLGITLIRRLQKRYRAAPERFHFWACR